MDGYCTQKGMPCEFANLNGYCQNTACTKLFSVTYEAYGFEPLTNADSIRAKSNEELAEFLMSNWFADNVCKNCEGEYDRCGDDKFCEFKILEWLSKIRT